MTKNFNMVTIVTRNTSLPRDWHTCWWHCIWRIRIEDEQILLRWSQPLAPVSRHFYLVWEIWCFERRSGTSHPHKSRFASTLRPSRASYWSRRTRSRVNLIKGMLFVFLHQSTSSVSSNNVKWIMLTKKKRDNGHYWQLLQILSILHCFRIVSMYPDANFSIIKQIPSFLIYMSTH
jgi:hypothetical protein